jgi:hypothetical protein
MTLTETRNADAQALSAVTLQVDAGIRTRTIAVPVLLTGGTIGR